MAIPLKIGETTAVPQSGFKELILDSDGNPVLLLSDASRESIGGGAAGLATPGGGVVSAATSGANLAPSAHIDIDPIYGDGSDETAALQNWIDSVPADQGADIKLPAGTIGFTGVTIASRKGITLRGRGRSATNLRLTAATGDGIVFDHCYSCTAADFTISSASKRTSGASLKVLGGHSDYIVGSAYMTNFIGQRVDFDKQFTSFEITDDDADWPGGAWNVTFMDSFCMDSANAADCFLIDSKHGGIHLIERVFAGPTGATPPDSTNRANSGLRIRASNDFTIDRFSQILMKNGLIIDPPAAKLVRAGNIHKCFWDSNTTYGVRIAGAGQYAEQIRFHDNWAASNLHNISLTGANVDRIAFIGGQCYRAGGWGALIDGATRTLIQGMSFGGATSGGIWLTGNAARTKIIDSEVGPGYEFGNPPVGLDIDAGCSRTIYGGNDFSLTTTPVTDGGTASLDMGNVVA